MLTAENVSVVKDKVDKTFKGRKEIMNHVSPVGTVYQAGTLSGNPIATTAGIETLKILMEDESIYERLNKKAEILEKAIEEANKESKNKVWVNRVGSLMSIFFTESKVCDYDSATSSDTERYAKYFRYLIENNIYVAPSQFEAMFISDAHSIEDIEHTAKIISEGIRL